MCAHMILKFSLYFHSLSRSVDIENARVKVGEEKTSSHGSNNADEALRETVGELFNQKLGKA